MIVNVHMLAYQPQYCIRKVDVSHVPNIATKPDWNVCNAVWSWGQNDLQPMRDIVSVSQGDVIELRDKYYLIAMVGFDEMTKYQFEYYRRLPRQERSWWLRKREDAISAKLEESAQDA
jgi:hypothetical protein